MSSRPADLVHARFSTESVAPRDRLPFYREIVGRQLGKWDLEPIGDDLSWRASFFALPDLNVADFAGTPVRIRRTREPAAAASDDLLFVIFHAGTASLSQRKRELRIDRPGACLLSSADLLSMQRTAASYSYLQIPRQTLAPLISNLDAALLSLIPNDLEALRLLIGYLDLLKNDGALATPELRRLVAAHVHDLVAMAIGATRDAAEMAKWRGLRAARSADLFVRAARLIDLRFRDPDLAPDQIARALGVSTRLLQRIFAERGKTVMQHVFEARVSRAEKLLAAPDAAHRPITDIAFSCGFNDSSHFGRVFAARTGMAPSQWRRRLQ